MIGLAAPPKTGKSLLAQQATLSMLEHNPAARVVWFNGELRLPMLQERALCMMSGLSVGAVRRNPPESDHQRERKADAIRRLQELSPRFVHVPAPFSCDTIEAAVRRHRPDWIVCDYLQLIVPPEGATSDVNATDMISGRLRAMTNSYNLVTIIVSSMSMSAATGTPCMSTAFKRSSTIGHDLSVGYAASLPKYDGPLPARVPIDWLCLGNRSGDPRPFTTILDRDCLTFFERGGVSI